VGYSKERFPRVSDASEKERHVVPKLFLSAKPFQQQRSASCIFKIIDRDHYNYILEACVAERLTPRTLDLEVRGSSLARRVVS